MSENRHPAGTSLGGQWAPGASAEVDDSVESADPGGLNDAESLRQRGGLGVGEVARCGQSHFMRSSRGLAALTRISDSRTSLHFFADDPRGDRDLLDSTFGPNDPDVPVIQAAVNDKPVVPIDEEGRGIETIHADRTLDEVLDDDQAVRDHITAWSPSSLGSFNEGESLDGALRRTGRGYYVLEGDSEDFERAEHFVRNYDSDRRLAESIPKLSNQQRAELINTVKNSHDDEEAEEAANDLTLDSTLHRTPYDPSRPPLRHIDDEFNESSEAAGMGDDPSKVFAYTVKPSSRGSEIDQVFEVVKNDVGSPVVKTHKNIGL